MTIACIAIVMLAQGCATTGKSELITYLHERQIQFGLSADIPQTTCLSAKNANIYLLGETHGIAANEELDFALLTYLYEHAGVRTYIAEVGYGAGRFLDEWVKTGNRRFLDLVYASLRGTAAWNAERYRFWERVREFNENKAPEEQIAVLGLDVEHQYPVGIYHLSLLLDGESTEDPIAVLVDEVQSIVADQDWSFDRSRDIALRLEQSLVDHRASWESFLGDRFARFVPAVDSLTALFDFRTSTGKTADRDRDRGIYDRFVTLSADYPGAFYGKWGSEHIHQREWRGINRFGALLDAPGSPYSGTVVSMLIEYDGGTRLYVDRRGEYRRADLTRRSRVLRYLSSVTGAGESTPEDSVSLFPLDEVSSPFHREPSILDQAADGVTTDYIQFIFLVTDARASTPLGTDP